MEFQNRMTMGLKQLENLPSEQKKQMLNAFIGNQVKFLATTDTIIEEMTVHKAVVSIANQSKVQNHIGTVHAAAMSLVAETATGMVLSMNIPDEKVQVAKSMFIKFIKPAKGNLVATATLTDEQIEIIRTIEKGEIQIPVQVIDEEGKEPLIAEIVWAWFPTKKNEVDITKFLQSDIKNVLAKLVDDKKPAWGNFTAQQMIEHLILSLKSSYMLEFDRNKTPKPEQIQAKKYILEGNNPYPRNLKNPFFKDGTPPPLQFETLEKAKENLHDEIKNFYAFFEKSENQEKLFFHPAYGGINYKEVEKFNYQHFNHHFLQFELV